MTLHTFCPYPYTSRETSQKVTHPITIPSQANLTMKFLSDGLPKGRCILLPLNSSHFGVIRSGCYMPISFHLVRSRTTPYWIDVCSDIICNILDFQFSTTLTLWHVMWWHLHSTSFLVKTLHRYPLGYQN
ncbi:hypothetical protein HKD37_19G052957 [Glycine soja]